MNNNEMTWETIRDAFYDDNGDKLDYFIQNCGYDVNYNENLRESPSNIPVLRACKTNAINCLRVLLKHGAEINKKIDFHQESSTIFFEVIEGCQSGCPTKLDMIHILLEHGADVNFPSHHDYLVSFFKYYITRRLNDKIVKLLFLYGLQYNAEFVDYTFLLTDPDTVKFYYDWPTFITLYCLEKRNKFFLF